MTRTSPGLPSEVGHLKMTLAKRWVSKAGGHTQLEKQIHVLVFTYLCRYLREIAKIFKNLQCTVRKDSKLSKKQRKKTTRPEKNKDR